MKVVKSVPQRGRPSCKEQILEAAEKVVTELGAGNLTLDAVAEYANVSKGGLLYHFPNKEALLNALLERFVFVYRDVIQDRFVKIPDCKNRYLKAFVMGLEEENDELDAMFIAVLASAANSPSEIPHLKECISDDWDEFKAQTKDNKFAVLVKFAIEGFAVMKVLGLSPLTEQENKDFIKLLYKVIERGSDE